MGPGAGNNPAKPRGTRDRARLPQQDPPGRMALGVLTDAAALPASPDFFLPCARTHAEGRGRERPPGQSRDEMFSEHHLAGRVSRAVRTMQLAT